MEIIFGKKNAEMLREKYTILELETFDVNGTPLETYCVIPLEKLSMSDLPELPQWIKLHEDFINGYKKKEYAYCLQCIDYLTGQFGGEMNSFYAEIKHRIDQEVKIN